MLELLIVMSVILLLAALIGPPVGSLLRGSNLTRGGDMIIGQLAQARQYAVTKNRLVEVRFYQYCSPTTPGEAGLSADKGRFRAVQSFEILEAGVATPLGKIQQLPDEVCINAGAALSSLIGGNTNASTGASLGMKIPQVGTAYNAVAFRFRPDGTINLDRTAKWFLTAHGTQAADGAAKPPPNYITIQVDPANGSVTSYIP
jgi:uncharacterized protein (TIGR02596 family)